MLSGRFPVVALALLAMVFFGGVSLAGTVSDKACSAEEKEECKTVKLAKIVITGSIEDALPPTSP